ncbi:uncharacterized protein LOC125659318 isoform X3 [Ostrea edulis]|uniref:uncharacterized protein LOC125659318 isoform X3 n=1 Tax=Ostrea edulis TaxID=37623 RepID=UPI0024AEC8A8|nr:uncharacterized protein LOC125659318 isoform X3 [Ostrea edulis]
MLKMEKLSAVSVSLNRINGEENYTTDDESDEKTEGKVSRKKIKRKKQVEKRSSSITRDDDGKDLPQEADQQETRTSETSQSQVNRGRSLKKTARNATQADIEERVTCKMCNKKYKNKYSLAHHIREYHKSKTMELSADESGDDSDTDELRCFICHKMYKNYLAYQKHLKSIHLEGELKKYSAETETSYNQGRKDIEMNKEKNEKEHEKEQGKEIPAHSEEEVETTFSEKEYSCPHCPKQFSRLCHVTNHINMKHWKGSKDGNTTVEEFSRQCKKNSQTRKKGETPKDKQECKFGEKGEISCEMCTDKFETSFLYGIHLEKFHGVEKKRARKLDPGVKSECSESESEDEEPVERVQCPACSKSYKKRKYYLAHWRKWHKNKKSVKVEGLSEKESTRNRELPVESENLGTESESEGEEPVERVQCPSCLNSYKRRRYWLAHWRKHHKNEKSVKVEGLCGKKSARNRNLPVESENLGTESEGEEPVKRIQCQACSKSYKTWKCLSVHWKNKHKEEKKIDLTDCDESTDDGDDIHGAKVDFGCTTCFKSHSFKCRFCEKPYTSFWYLRRHYRNEHKHGLQSTNHTSVTASGDQRENLCIHCNNPGSIRFWVDKGVEMKGESKLFVRGRENMVKSPLIVDCKVDWNLMCSCGLTFMSKTKLGYHMDRYADYHPNKSYRTLKGDDIHLIKSLACSFCGRSFKSSNGLLRHLKRNHFRRKTAETDDDIVERNKKKTSSPGIRGSVTDSECEDSSIGNNAKFFWEKRRSDPTGKYSAKSLLAPEETCSNLAYPDPETIFHMSKNTTVSDEDIVTEILTNSAEKIGPIRLLDAESPKKSIQKFKNFSITVTADTENAVRVVTKKSENKLRKYSNEGSRTPFLSEAFVFKKQNTDDREMEKMEEGCNSRDCIGTSIVTCDKDKVKAVNVGVDDDTSSEDGKSPTQNTHLETVTFNVQTYLNNSPSKYSPFVKLIKVDESNPKMSQRHMNKYAASKSVSTKSLPSAMTSSRAVLSRRKSFESNMATKVGFETDDASFNKADHPELGQLGIEADSHMKELQLQLGHGNQTGSTSTGESDEDVCEPSDSEMRDLEGDITIQENNTVSDIPMDVEPFVLRKEKHSQKQFGEKSGQTTMHGTHRGQQVPKQSRVPQVISPKSSQSILKSDQLVTISGPLYTDQKSSSSSQNSFPSKCHVKKSNTQSTSTSKSGGKLVAAPSNCNERSLESSTVAVGERGSSPKKAQMYWKKTSAKKVTAKKNLCVLRKLLTEKLPDNPFHLQNKPSVRSISSCEENSEKLLRSGKTVSRGFKQGGTSSRGNNLTRPYLKRNTTISKIQAIKCKLQGIKNKSKPKQKSIELIMQDNEKSQDADSYKDQDFDGSISSNQHEFEEERTIRIESLKKKMSFLSHKTSELKQMPLQVPMKEVDNSLQSVRERTSSSTSTERKKSKLKASKRKLKLNRGRIRPISREEVPITPEKNIEDSIHFPQQFGLSGSREKGGGQRRVRTDLQLPLVRDVESVDHTGKESRDTRHTDTGSEKNNPPSRRTRSWSPVKSRTERSTPKVTLVENVVGSPNEDKQPVGYNVVGYKMPVIKLNKLEEQVDGKYLKLLWEAVGKSSQSTQSTPKERSKKSLKSNSVEVRRRSLSADSALGFDVGEDKISKNTERVELSRNGDDAERKGLYKYFSLKENLDWKIDSRETALKISEDVVSSASSKEKKREMEAEEHSPCSLIQDISNEEMSDHQGDSEKEDAVETTVACDKSLRNVKVERAIVDETGVVNNRAHVLFVHENKIVYADAPNVVPVDEKGLTSLRNQVDEKRLRSVKSRKRKAIEDVTTEDETDGNIHPTFQPKRKEISSDILKVCAGVVDINTPLKPLKALEVKAVNEGEEVVSSTIEGNLEKKEMMACMIGLMELAEDVDKESHDFQIIEPSFLIKKDEKIKYSCHKCDINFNLKTSLKHHRSTCHPEDEFRSFDIDKKSSVVENVVHAAQNFEVVDDLSTADDKDTLYSMPVAELRECIGLMWGIDFNAYLILEKLKLEKTIKVADLTLNRVHKQTWRIVNETRQSVSNTVSVEHHQHGDLLNLSVEEEKGQENSPTEQCFNDMFAVSEQIPNMETVGDCTHHLTEKEATSHVNDTEYKISLGESLGLEQIPNMEMLGDCSHHLTEKETTSHVNDTECKISFGESLGTTNAKSSCPVSKKKKLQNVKIDEDSKSKLKINEKSLPTPLTEFERAIMEPKEKRKKLKRKLSAAESEKDLATTTSGDHSKPVHGYVADFHLKEKPKANKKVGSVVPQSKIVQKILRDKAREEEMESRKLVPVTDEALPSFEEILQQKPSQDVGHVEKFRFGAKQNKKISEPKPTVVYSMGMAGSNAVSVPSSKKVSLETQSLQDIYNAILEGIQNPQIIGKKSDVLSCTLKNSQFEEPSTSTGIKRAADVYASASKKAKVESRIGLREEDMTPDSTTPDKYLEQGTSEMDTTTQEAMPNEMNNIGLHSSVVSSNVSSTGESGVWKENEVSHQSGKTGLEKQGIPKFTSTPLKQDIPNSKKSPCHIPEYASTTETVCSRLELGENLMDSAGTNDNDIKEDSKTNVEEGIKDDVESMEYKLLQDQMEVQDVKDEQRRDLKCHAKNKDDAMECNDEDKDSIKSRSRDDRESEDEEEDKDESEEEDDAEKSEESESEKESETSEESDQESESEAGRDCDVSKYTNLDIDVDVLNVCASDEESWLNEEEEEMVEEEKEEMAEEEKITDDERDEDGDLEEKEEDDICVKEELVKKEEALAETRSARDIKDETDNVIVMESTVECEDIDFKPNTIMVNLIPKGFCFQFIHYNVCNKPMCSYKHNVPSKDEIFKKGLREISRLHSQSDKMGAYEIYKKLLELNFHDQIPTKHIMQLLRLAEEDCDMNMAFDLLSHAEKIKSIEFHAILISMCSLCPAHYEENLWTLFSCIQNFSKCLTSQNVVILLRAFQEKQQWLKLWNVINYSLHCHGFLPPAYITRSALQAVQENPEICIQEAAHWIQKCDPEQFYNQDVELLGPMADVCLQHNFPKAASTLRSVANKTQPAIIENSLQGNIVDKDSDVSSVNSEDRSSMQENVNSDEHKSLIHRIMGVRFSKNWEYLAQTFLELSNLEQARDPRFIRAFVDVFTWEKSNPNSLVDSFKDFFEFVNCFFIKEKTEDVLSKMDRSSLAMIGAELVNFCALSQWWREGLSVIQILQKNNVQYLTRKSPGGALMSTIAIDVCLRCKKPYQAVQLITACQWSCVDGLKIDKPDFRERVVHLNTLVKQFLALKRPVLALTVICKVLQKANRGFEENFHAIMNLCMEVGDPRRAYAAFEVFKNGYTSAVLNVEMLRRLVTACGESQYSIPGAHNIYNYLTALNVYPTQDIPIDPRPLCVKLTMNMSHVESIILIEDFMLWLYNFLCDWCVQHETVVVPEEYLIICVRFADGDAAGPHQRMMERKLKELKNLMDIKFTPGLQTFLRPPMNDGRGIAMQITSPSVFNYLLALDKGERGKFQGFRRKGVGVGGPKSGPWNRRDSHCDGRF